MGAPLGSAGVPLGFTSRILLGTQMVYGAKYHTELSITPYTHMVGVPLRSVGGLYGLLHRGHGSPVLLTQLLN